jgi:hypothetical protein
MDLITPESLGGAGVSLGAIALYAFIRAAGKISLLVDKLTGGSAKIGDALQALGAHLGEEKRHHKAMEESSQEQVAILRRLERGNSQSSGDHTLCHIEKT